MPTMKEITNRVNDLENIKGFGHRLEDKILWMGQEYGELIRAFKKGDEAGIAEEAIDVLFFVASILNILGQDGDKLFIDKWKVNMRRLPELDANGKPYQMGKVREYWTTG